MDGKEGELLSRPTGAQHMSHDGARQTHGQQASACLQDGLLYGTAGQPPAGTLKAGTDSWLQQLAQPSVLCLCCATVQGLFPLHLGCMSRV